MGILAILQHLIIMGSQKSEHAECAELCSLAEGSAQGHFSGEASHMCSGTFSRQKQAEIGKPLYERETFIDLLDRGQYEFQDH